MRWVDAAGEHRDPAAASIATRRSRKLDLKTVARVNLLDNCNGFSAGSSCHASQAIRSARTDVFLTWRQTASAARRAGWHHTERAFE